MNGHRVQHSLERDLLTFEVGHDGAFEFRGDEVNLDGTGLSKAPAPTHSLICLFERIRSSNEYHSMATLEIHSVSENLRLRNQDWPFITKPTAHPRYFFIVRQ